LPIRSWVYMLQIPEHNQNQTDKTREKIMQDNEQDMTIAKTLWSETLIDALLVALQKKHPDEKIRELLKEIQDKGYKPTYIIEKVTKELDAQAVLRVRQLLAK